MGSEFEYCNVCLDSLYSTVGLQRREYSCRFHKALLRDSVIICCDKSQLLAKTTTQSRLKIQRVINVSVGLDRALDQKYAKNAYLRIPRYFGGTHASIPSAGSEANQWWRWEGVYTWSMYIFIYFVSFFPHCCRACKCSSMAHLIPKKRSVQSLVVWLSGFREENAKRVSVSVVAEIISDKFIDEQVVVA